jgi:hypothetical protein
VSDKRFVLAAAALLTVALPLALAAPMAKDKPGDKPRAAARSADADDPSKLKTETFAGLAFRGIGPAVTVQVGHLFDASARAVGIVAVVASSLTAAVLEASGLERSARLGSGKLRLHVRQRATLHGMHDLRP